jgi:hypothetical protein
LIQEALYRNGGPLLLEAREDHMITKVEWEPLAAAGEADRQAQVMTPE